MSAAPGLRFPALLAPLWLAVPIAAQGIHPEPLYGAVEELARAKASGAPRARIDELYGRLEELAAAAGVTPGHVLAQCGPVASTSTSTSAGTGARTPAAPSGSGSTSSFLSAPPCGGATLTTTTFTSTARTLTPTTEVVSLRRREG